MRMRSRRLLLTSMLIALLGVMVSSSLNSAERKDRAKGLRKGSGIATLDYQNFDGNRINSIMGNNGQYVSHVVTGHSGMEWPNGSHKLIDFAAGIWVAGKLGNDFRTAAAEYAVEFAPGVILPNGQPDDPNDPKYRWYKITRADLTNPGEDYLNWPVDQGAPVNDDGTPALIGDQMMWCVFNDANSALHANVFGTEAMGLEIHMTVWGYNRPDAFGDMMFVKAKIINKSNNSYDSTFVALWDDPDLGDAADDYVGCDTTLSLGYCWNADNSDATYGVPPALGRDFFQGPIVPSPGDTANVSGRKVPGYRNLPMYAFAYYINGAVYPRRDPDKADEVFNYMKGTFQDGSPFVDPITGRITRFVFPGDPETGTGWTELTPSVEAPGDRRFLMSSGPFTFAPGDTQEVVFGVLIAQGTSFRNSVTKLKQIDAVAQLAYDLNFALPPSPPTPNVVVSELDREIVLYWDDIAESYSVPDLIDRDPNGDPTEYNFEGYIVYQVDAAAGFQTVKRLAVYDIANGITDIKDLVFDDQRGEQIEATVVKGNDRGVERFFRTKTDAITGLALSNARTYYFAVTAYGYNPYGIPKMYEGPLKIIRATPAAPPPGVRYLGSFGDPVPVEHTGPGDGSVIVSVIDPSRVTGDQYRVQFRVDTATGKTVWDLINVTRGVIVLAGQTNQSGDGAFTIVDGLQVKVTGPALDMKGVMEVANSAGPHEPTQGTFLFNASEFPTVIPCDPIQNPCDRPAANPEGTRWGIHTGAGGIDGDFHYPMFRGRVFRGTNFTRFIPFDWELRFTARGGKAWLAFTTGAVIDVPFELWNIGINTPDDPSDDYRLIPLIFDADGNGAFNLMANDHPISGGDNDPETDWFYWYRPVDRSPGTAGYDAWESTLDDDLIENEVMARMVLVNFNGGSVADPTFPANVSQTMPPTGTVFRIIATKPNSPADEFAFSTSNVKETESAALAKSDIAKINVVPNPYLGSQVQERNPLNRFVTFTRLPDKGKTTIRIFSLSGVHIRTLEHGPGSTFERWDLRNSNDLPVASGMYLVHIEIEGVGTKVLKLGIIQPEERLDRL